MREQARRVRINDFEEELANKGEGEKSNSNAGLSGEEVHIRVDYIERLFEDLRLKESSGTPTERCS